MNALCDRLYGDPNLDLRFNFSEDGSCLDEISVYIKKIFPFDYIDREEASVKLFSFKPDCMNHTTAKAEEFFLNQMGLKKLNLCRDLRIDATKLKNILFAPKVTPDTTTHLNLPSLYWPKIDCSYDGRQETSAYSHSEHHYATKQELINFVKLFTQLDSINLSYLSIIYDKPRGWELLRDKLLSPQDLAALITEVSRSSKNLTSINLSHNQITKEVIDALLLCPNLEEIDLSCTNCDPDSIGALAQCPKLRVLDLEFASDRSSCMVGTPIALKDINIFFTCGRPIMVTPPNPDPRKEPVLRALGNPAHGLELTLLQHKITPANLQTRMSSLSNLTGLYFSVCEFFALHMNSIASCKSLKSLKLQCCNIRIQEGQNPLTTILKECTELRVLDLSYSTNVTDSIFDHLPKDSKLQIIDVSRNRRASGLKDQTLEKIALRCQGLHYLNLADNTITDAGIRTLARINPLSLTHLGLNQCPNITIQALHAIYSNPFCHIENITLHDSGVTEQDLRAFKNAHPQYADRFQQLYA